MTTTTIGKLQRVPLRKVWPHEALDFTRWLEDNIDVVNEAIGVELTNAEREQAAGAFSVDVLAEDEEGNFTGISLSCICSSGCGHRCLL